MNNKRWLFLPIENQHQREGFDCGYPVLNDYLKKYARQNHKKGIAKTFVAISSERGQKIQGYYTLSASVIEFDSLPQTYQKKLPAYPIPALLKHFILNMSLFLFKMHLYLSFYPFQPFPNHLINENTAISSPVN